MTRPGQTPHRFGLGRCVGVGAGAWGVAGALVWLAAPLLPWATGEVLGPGFADGLVGLCAAATALCGVWLGVVSTFVAVDAARARSPRRLPACPEAVQRWLLAACGAALVTGLATPALAADRRPERPPAPLVQPLAGLPLPDRVVAGPRPARPPVRTAHAGRPGHPRSPCAPATASGRSPHARCPTSPTMPPSHGAGTRSSRSTGRSSGPTPT